MHSLFSGLNTLIMFILFIFLLQPARAATQISQFDITWTFDRDYEVGQFANGDYWVLGPVSIVHIDPPSIEADGRVRNGSMINPSPMDDTLQGYDSIMHNYGSISIDSYRSSLNVGRPNGHDLTANNPLLVSSCSSLISTRGFESSHRPQTQNASILTVLGQRPPEASFRPPYSGTDKRIQFSKSQLDYRVLARLTPVSGATLFAVERRFERPWIDHIPSFLARYQHPAENMHDYSRDFAKDIGNAALILNLDYTNAEKERLLIRFVQLGIDNHRNIQLGSALPYGNWPPIEGQNMGRKLPIVFAGKVLGGKPNNNDPASNMLNVGTWWTTGVVFQEDLNTFVAKQDDVGRAVKGVNKGYGVAQEYTLAHIGLPEWGSRHYGPYSDISRDDSAWNANYRGICAVGMLGHALAVHIMGLRSAWDRETFLDYHDRWFQLTNGQEHNDRVLPPFTKNMWLAYRHQYPPVWPDDVVIPLVDETAQSITCPGDITVEAADTTGLPGDAVITAFIADASVSDECNPSVVITQDGPMVFPIGATTVLFTATDDSDNSSTCTAIVTVVGAKGIKANAIALLTDAATDDKKVAKVLNDAITYINNSLGIGDDHVIWLDEIRIDPQHGRKVFDHEKDAVDKLEFVMKDASGDLEIICQAVIDKLVAADFLLATAAFEEGNQAYNDSDDDRVRIKIDKALSKSLAELTKADDELKKGDSSRAIDHIKTAWEHAQCAVGPAPNAAEDGNDSGGKKGRKK